MSRFWEDMMETYFPEKDDAMTKEEFYKSPHLCSDLEIDYECPTCKTNPVLSQTTNCLSSVMFAIMLNKVEYDDPTIIRTEVTCNCGPILDFTSPICSSFGASEETFKPRIARIKKVLAIYYNDRKKVASWQGADPDAWLDWLGCCIKFNRGELIDIILKKLFKCDLSDIKRTLELQSFMHPPPANTFTLARLTAWYEQVK